MTLLPLDALSLSYVVFAKQAYIVFAKLHQSKPSQANLWLPSAGQLPCCSLSLSHSFKALL